jgi:hypothetical protein
MNTPDTTKLGKQMRKMGRRTYTDARVGFAKATASRPEIGSRGAMIAGGAAGAAGAAASMMLGKAARRRVEEEEAAPPIQAHTPGATPHSVVDGSVGVQARG